MEKRDIFAAAHRMGGDRDKPKKEVHEIRTRKAKSGGYIHKHVHTHPEHHPDEEHISPDQDAMVSHMMEHMGAQNTGEAEADAGQGGAPAMPGQGGASPMAGAVAAPATGE